MLKFLAALGLVLSLGACTMSPNLPNGTNCGGLNYLGSAGGFIGQLENIPGSTASLEITPTSCKITVTIPPAK